MISSSSPAPGTYIARSIFCSALFASLSLAGALAGVSSAQSTTLDSASGISSATAASHVTFAPDADTTTRSAETELQDEAAVPTPTMAPTRSSFLATWPAVKGATAYELDVATDSSFSHYVGRYHEISTGNAPFALVSGLQPTTRYYYRVRTHDASGASRYSETMTGATNSGTSLVITPDFDSSVFNSPKSAAIQATVMTAIANYAALFRDPLEVRISFRYASTQPDGTPLPMGVVSSSGYVYYDIDWSTYINALKADAVTQTDASANSTLPATQLSADIATSSAGGRAIGLNTPPALNGDGTVTDGGPLDGIVTFNSNAQFRFARPAVAGSYDALASCEHEIDEILGLGSHLNLSIPNSAFLRPEDLFTWAAPHARNSTSLGPRYFSIDPGITKIVDLNQDGPGDYGDWDSPACPQPIPLVQSAYGCPGQIADIGASSPEGIMLDVTGYDMTPAFDAVPPTVANISTRLKVEKDDGALIGGFIVSGTAPKKVLLRAIGPSLSLPGNLLNPTLELHSTEALIASNDDWQSDQKAEIEATGVAPSDARESAIVATLDPGVYTAIVQGAAGGTGLSLVEIYDLDTTTDSSLSNISTRGTVGTGDNVLIGGFIILGDDSARVLMRALGPSLPVAGALKDPTLELHDSNGTLIASDDNWRENQEPTIQATGIPPINNAEAAIVSTLAPGNYTVIVQGHNGTTGVALVEAYHLPDTL